MYAYVVTVWFETPDAARLFDAWLQWMTGTHLAEVLAAGASSASLVQRDDVAPFCCEAHYRFPTKLHFEAYLRDSAPRLRAEGLRLFPTEAGIRYSRSTGEVIWEKSAG